MNIQTGEIKFFSAGENLPKHFVPLAKLPMPRCPHCKGKGHLGLIKQAGKRGKIVRALCSCVQ